MNNLFVIIIKSAFEMGRKKSSEKYKAKGVRKSMFIAHYSLGPHLSYWHTDHGLLTWGKWRHKHYHNFFTLPEITYERK